jgi:phosphopantothenoylcysteine synthetase/decarboxylase
MKRVLITAGPSIERIDDVRAWSNIFTGGTGLAIAKHFARDCAVDLVTSNRSHLAGLEPSIRGHAFTSHVDLSETLGGLIKANAYDAILMTAAVADYAPVGSFAVESVEQRADGTQAWIVRDVQAPKIKSTHGRVAVMGERTPKIVDRFRRDWGYRGLLIKFKLEVAIDDAKLIEVARASRRTSDADYIVANTLAMTTGERAGAYLLTDTLQEWVERDALAMRLRALVG